MTAKLTIAVYRDLYGSTDEQCASGAAWAWGCAEHHEGGSLDASSEEEALAAARKQWPDATIELGDDRTDDA